MSQHERYLDPRRHERELVFEIEQREFQSDLCIVYDPEDDRRETWITTREGSHRSVCDCR